MLQPPNNKAQQEQNKRYFQARAGLVNKGLVKLDEATKGIQLTEKGADRAKKLANRGGDENFLLLATYFHAIDTVMNKREK